MYVLPLNIFSAYHMSTHEIAEEVGSSWQMKVPSAALDMYTISATIVATVALSIDEILAQTMIRVEFVGLQMHRTRR